MALEIQQSINQMLSSAGTMAGIYKAIKAPEEAEKRKAEEHAKQQETAKTEAIAAAADTRKLFGLDDEIEYGEVLAAIGEGDIQVHREELKQRYQLLDKMGRRYEGFIPGYADTMSNVYNRLQMAEGELHSRLKAEQAAKQAEAKRREMILNPTKEVK